MRATGLIWLASVLALGLSACGESRRKDAAQAETGNGPDAAPGMVFTEGRLVLPAVKGNPGAAYFSVFNGSKAEVALVAVAIEGAGKAEMHRSAGGAMEKLAEVAIKPTWTQRFIPGARHVMAFDLDPGLQAGGTTEVTLIFADGDKLSAPLAIEGPGGGAAGGGGHESHR
jgi:periplasmic copper chaperone A